MIENPVYVDDSPQAWELFRQAQDQTRNNAGEAVRLYQELLDEFPQKLIPASDASPDFFKAVRARVIGALMSDQSPGGLLERYRTMQEPAAEQMLQADELDLLAMSRPLTASGLEAMLRLSQRELESGRFSMAKAWLAEAQNHPDLAGRRAVLHLYMSALASHYLGDSNAASQAITTLNTFGLEGEASRAALEELIKQPPPITQTSVSTLDFGQSSELNDLVAQAIWSVPLEDSLVRRRIAALQQDVPLSSPAAADGLLQQRLRDADFSTSIPTVAGEVVYINEGHTIRAIHRLTGRQIWKYTSVNRLSLSERDVVNALDMNVVTVTSGPDAAVVTLTGHAQANTRSEAGRLICFEASTGELRWSLSTTHPPLIDAPQNEQLFPHGTPIVVDDTVFVAARRVSMQAITSVYVIAVDLVTGKVRWLRNITSSGGLRAGIRPFDSLVFYRSTANNSSDPGGLYLSTAVGAMARLEPATGEIRWLSRFSAPINIGMAEFVRRPWEIGGPTLTRRGLLAIQSDQRRIVLVDPETGSLLESHGSTSNADWNQPRYLLSDDKRVYAIGTEIRAFDLEMLEVPVWRLPEPQQSIPGRPATSTTTASLELRGRVQLVDGALIVPTSSGVWVVNSETGEVVNTLPLDTVGNPLAVRSQLLMACGDRLDSYMSFNTAERMLRDRIAQSSDEPEPALSLMRLGMRVGNFALSLEAAELALRAANQRLPIAQEDGAARPAGARGELISLLLELASSDLLATPTQGESLYALMNAAAVERSQRVEYLLSYGAWLTIHALDRAVETYQTVLSSPQLATTWREDPSEPGAARPAAAWARERLNDLILQRGRMAYAPQADFAALRVRQLTAATPIDPAALRAVADEFPFSDAAVAASIAAADVHARSGETRAAVAALLANYRAAPSQANAARLLGKAISICKDAGWMSFAHAAAAHAQRTYGDQPLTIGAAQITPSRWLADHGFPPLDGSHDLPSIGVRITEAQPLAGSIVEPFRSTPGLGRFGGNELVDTALADRLLMRTTDTLRLIGPNADTLAPMWGAQFPDEIPQLLRLNQDDILLWKSDPQDPKAVMLNAADGTTRWTTPKLDDLFADPVRDLGRSRGVRDPMPDGEPFDPQQTIPLVGDNAIFLVRRTGGVIAIDLNDGTTVHWQQQQTLEQVHSAALHQSALVLAGLAKHPTDASQLVPRVLVLDPQTGNTMIDQSPSGDGDLLNLAGNLNAPATASQVERGGIKWIRISPLGVLVMGVADGLHAVDLLTGARLWSTAAFGSIDTQRAWLMDDHLILEDARSRLRTVRLNDGVMSDPFEMPQRGEWDPSELRQILFVNGRIIAHYPQRVVMYDPTNGSITGADVISDDRDFRFLLPAKNRLVLINSRTVQAPVPDQPGRRTQQWVYRLYVLSENCKVLSEPLQLPPLNERVQYATLLDGWLFLSTPSETLAMPMVD